MRNEKYIDSLDDMILINYSAFTVQYNIIIIPLEQWFGALWIANIIIILDVHNFKMRNERHIDSHDDIEF